MAGDKTFGRFVADKTGAPVKEEEPVEGDDKAVSIGRIGGRPQLSIRFKLMDGTGCRFSYSHFYRVIEEEPGAVLVVEFSEHLVRIEGAELGMLEQWIGDHKARVVEEQPEKARGAGFGKAEPAVFHIEITAKADQA